jgi:hypothetical protein
MVHEVLDGTVLRLKVDAYRMNEDLETGTVSIHCDVHDAVTGDRKTLEGQGVGIVDAFFRGIIRMYSAEFQSLTTIAFSDFSIRGNMSSGHHARSDSEAQVTLRVVNSDGVEYEFADASPSMTRSAINVVLHATAFFINSERAFTAVYKAMQHAKAENRSDSVARYTDQLTTLVKATSYTEVIAQIRADALGLDP